MLRVRVIEQVALAICVAILAAAWPICGRAEEAGKAEYQVYSCRYKSATDVEKSLAELLPDDPSVHLVVDAKTNSLLLRGPAEVQAIARSLLAQVDQPSTTEATAGASHQSVVRAYACPAAEVDRWLGIVRATCGARSDVKVTASRATNQLLVLAPPEVQQQIARRMTEGLRTSLGPPAGRGTGEAERNPPLDLANGPAQPLNAPANPDVPDYAINSPSSPVSGPNVDRVLSLRSVPAEGMEQRLIALFGRRLLMTQRDGKDIYILPANDRATIEFQFDRSRNIVLVRGAEALVTQFVQLVDALDSNSQRGLRTRALHVERTAPNQLRQAVDAYRGRTDAAPKNEPERQEQAMRAANEGSGAVRLVNYVFQQQQGGGEAGGAASGSEDLGTVVPNVPGLEDLEVQTLPDLDVIILRGRDQDVEQLTKIIRELERLSAETKPKIYIYPLKHVRGESIKDIIDQVQEDLVGRRQGRVSITPLTKPNSLLLIGWGEAVEAVTELITKLDRPVPPESQFSVFSLKHAAVATVQQTIQQFFGTRPALGPQVQLAIDARTNSLIVYAAPRDMREVERLVRELDVAKSGAVNRAQIFRVYNALAADLADTLDQAISASQAGQTGRSAVLELLAVDDAGQEIVRSGMLNEVNITPNSRNNTLIVTGPPEAMPLIAAFIEQLDAPGDRAQIKVFRVINGDATNLVSMLRSLIPSQAGQTLGPQLPSVPEEESLAPLRFSVEVRSNSIIAIGSEGDLRIVEALLTRLDQSESMNRKNAIYLLKNAPAVDVAASINQFLQSQRQLEAAEPGQSNPFQDLEREVIVVPEPVRNRLIVSATPRYFDEITQLIEKLDEPPPQVIIQVLIAEVQLGDEDELGVELGLQDSVLFDRSLLGDLLTTTNTSQVSDPNGILTVTEEIIRAASLTPGFNFNNTALGNSGSDASLDTAKKLGGQSLTNFDVGRTNETAGYGGLVLSAGSRNISILIRALQESRELRILSRPIVRTLDNQPAFIQVGQRVPRIVGSTLSQIGQSNMIDQENVGLILGVTPRISPDGNVVMEVDAEKSKVGPESEGIPVTVSLDGTVIRSPRVDTITAQTTVSVADGETVVLGGMISTETETVERRAPYLADIPVLGHLFRFDSRNERRTEMIIILTPHVIRTPEDGERLKQAEFARMSWCAADVYDLYGDVGINFRTSLSVPSDDTGTEVIYPDDNPRGERMPTPADVPTGGYPDAPAPGAIPTPRASDIPQPIPPLPTGDVRPFRRPAGGPTSTRAAEAILPATPPTDSTGRYPIQPANHTNPVGYTATAANPWNPTPPPVDRSHR